MTTTLARRAASVGPTPTTTGVYRGTVRHRRSTPVTNEFSHRLFLAYLDVDALPGSLDRLPLWSGRRMAPVRFRRRDFFNGGIVPLGPSVRDLVESRLGRRPDGPIYLLAQLRTFGWLFNPLAVYYCWQPGGGTLDAIVLEVTNTPWGERHHYVLDARQGTTARHAKALHVSPFLPMEMQYRITWTVPGDELSLRIAAGSSDPVEFEADLSLRRLALDRRRAVTILVSYPLMPMRVSASIYRHALRLLHKGVPVHGHPSPRSRGRHQ